MRVEKEERKKQARSNKQTNKAKATQGSQHVHVRTRSACVVSLPLNMLPIMQLYTDTANVHVQCVYMCMCSVCACGLHSAPVRIHMSLCIDTANVHMCACARGLCF